MITFRKLLKKLKILILFIDFVNCETLTENCGSEWQQDFSCCYNQTDISDFKFCVHTEGCENLYHFDFLHRDFCRKINDFRYFKLAWCSKNSHCQIVIIFATVLSYKINL